MPLNFLSALKVIPWGDVITAAPGVVKGARKMFARGEEERPAPQPVDVPAGDPLHSAYQRIGELEANVTLLREQQQAAAVLLKSLAEQHAQVVQAIEILRVRTRLLLWTSGALGTMVIAGLLALSYVSFSAR